MAREFVGRWSGRVAEGAEAQHEAFVAELRSAEGSDLLRRFNLTEYSVYQLGQELEVIFKSDRPSIIAGFLKNKRLWPSFWEFTQPGNEEGTIGKDLLLQWRRENPDQSST